MPKNKRFDEAFNFEHFKSSNSAHDFPIGQELIEQLEQEFMRISKLNIPLEITHIEDVNGLPQPVQYPTNYKQAINGMNLLSSIRKKIEIRRSSLLKSAVNGLVSIEQVKELMIEQDLETHAMLYTFFSMGKHSQEVNDDHFTQAGINKCLGEKHKADERFSKEYWKSLRVMRDILYDFYSYEENHPFKPQLVIDHIEMLCEENGLKFPKNRKSKNFKDYLNKFLKFIPQHENWSGATKKQYKHIDRKIFYKKYQPLLDNIQSK